MHPALPKPQAMHRFTSQNLTVNVFQGFFEVQVISSEPLKPFTRWIPHETMKRIITTHKTAKQYQCKVLQYNCTWCYTPVYFSIARPGGTCRGQGCHVYPAWSNVLLYLFFNFFCICGTDDKEITCHLVIIYSGKQNTFLLKLTHKK